ncbi:ABC transporter permease [Pseudochelatococcus sp. B33]
MAPAAAILALAVGQELALAADLLDAHRFPALRTILGEFVAQIASGAIRAPLERTLLTWISSLIIAFLIAIALGIPIGRSRNFRALTAPLIEFLRPIPSTALIPLVILAIGANIQGALTLVVFATVWQVLPMIIRGSATVDLMALDTARVFGLSDWQRLKWVILPSMEPYLLTGLRIGTTISLLVLISMELFVGVTGIGRVIAISYAGANMPVMYTYIIIAGLLGATANLILIRIVRLRSRALKGAPQ